MRRRASADEQESDDGDHLEHQAAVCNERCHPAIPEASRLRRACPGRTLALVQHLLAAGLASQVIPMLVRKRAVPKSSFARPGERPSVAERYASFVGQPLVGAGTNIVIVDDVVTKGSTALAAASRIADIMLNTTIRLFAVIRTKRLVPDVDRIVEPTVGTIRLFFGACTDSPRVSSWIRPSGPWV